MAKGFKDDKGRFRPTAKSPLSRKKQKTVDTSRGTLITEGEFSFTPRESGVTWETAIDRFVDFRDDNPDLEAFSFDPEINSGFNFLDPDMVINFHDLHVKGGQQNPVFVIGVTNQLGGTPTRELQSAYEQVKNEGKIALIGFFTDGQDNQFTDISFPISGIDREEAIQLADDNAQDSVSVVFSDGTFSIETVQ